MHALGEIDRLYKKFVVPENHGQSDYFSLIRELVAARDRHEPQSAGHQAWQAEIDKAYALVLDEIQTNRGRPRSPVSFGTSGWRGIIGKDIFSHSITQVTEAIVQMYRELGTDPELAAALGVKSLEEARARGVVVGHDNRFGGNLLAQNVVNVLTAHGFAVHFAGEATTGTLSAAVLILNAAFSVNLTPSHNPLDYAGFKYNAADAGPAAQVITDQITAKARALVADNKPVAPGPPDPSLVKSANALDCWFTLVKQGGADHGLFYEDIMKKFAQADNCVAAVDCVHGASRVHIRSLLPDLPEKVLLFRATADPTFGGVAPEPSAANMAQVEAALRARPEPLKIGVIIDPDGDRIRFTDGTREIDMNMFGAMAYHFLHEDKGKKGMVAKTVATSNFANSIARALGEEVFEPRVGFKEFKPVIGKALVCFEESDGISVIGHTPEKDAYIGLLLALDMILARQQNLGDFLEELQDRYGRFFPVRGGVAVSKQGEDLMASLELLRKYGPGEKVLVGGEEKRIQEVITIDGRKMIFEDGSWLMIRPSGTEPKVRFYVEARSESGKKTLLAAAKSMLAEIGLL